jgi:hypothetical protein
MGRLLMLAVVIVASYSVWHMHPFGIGEASAAEHQLRDQLNLYAERDGMAKPKSVSCDKWGTEVNPPTNDGIGLHGNNVESDPPDFTLFKCAVEYEGGLSETWCYSDQSDSYGRVWPRAIDCARVPGAVPKS